MYKLISIEEYVRTRTVELLNLQTGTIESCFDYSDTTFGKDFSFMQIGGIYNCSIQLFGVRVDTFCEDAVPCRIKGVEMIGKKAMIKVLVGKDEYYVRLNESIDTSIGTEFYYSFTRKDLIRVDSVIHGDFLRIRP